MMMYETAMPLESSEDMTDGIMWEENTVFVMETDGLCCLPGIVKAGAEPGLLCLVAGWVCWPRCPQW